MEWVEKSYSILKTKTHITLERQGNESNVDGDCVCGRAQYGIGCYRDWNHVPVELFTLFYTLQGSNYMVCQPSA